MQVRDRPLGVFLIVVYKLVWGVLDVLAGAFLHKMPAFLHAQAAADPENQLARWLLRHAPIDPGHLMAITLVLLAVGVGKIVLAFGIWYKSWLIRDLAVWVLALGGLVAIGAMIHHFTLVRLIALGIDLVILWYLWRKLPRYLGPRHPQASSAPA